MIFDRPSITSPERRMILFRNASGVTIARGTPVIINTVTVDGVGVALAGTNLLSLFTGIAFEGVLDGAYGRFQVAGYCDYATVANHPSTATIIGDVLGLVAAQVYLQRIAAGDGKPHFAISLESIAANAVITPVARKVMLRL